jgi:ElaA protein
MNKPMTPIWDWKSFSELSIEQVYAIMALRQQVFVVEQNCPYLDADGLDICAWHLLGSSAENGLMAYLRVLPPGKKYHEAAIGRVLTSLAMRRKGLGRRLMLEGIRRTRKQFPGQAIRLSAQCYAERFYRDLGFEPVGESYLEDDIPHVDMVRSRFE